MRTFGILIQEAASKTVAIYPGRFHPFTRGHKSVYEFLKSKYDDVYIATSDKVEPPKSPFTFDEKKSMMLATGIPEQAIVQTKNPYKAEEILSKYDPDNTSVIFAVSEKDMKDDPRFQFAPKKDGSKSYFQPMTDDREPFSKFGYIEVAPTLKFSVLGKPMQSATELRSQFASADEGTQRKIVEDLYGKFDENIFRIMKAKLTAQPS